MKMKQRAGTRTRLGMKRRMLFIAATGASILGLALFLTIAFNIGNVRDAMAGSTTYYTRTDGDWKMPTTWSTTNYGGSAAKSYPKAGDKVFISNAVMVLNEDAICTSITIESNAKGKSSGSLTVSKGWNLTTSDDLEMNCATGKCNLVLNVQDNSKVTIGGNLMETSTGGSGNAQINIISKSYVSVKGSVNLINSGGSADNIINLKESSQLSIAGNLNITQKTGGSTMEIVMEDDSKTTVNGNVNLLLSGKDYVIVQKGKSTFNVQGNVVILKDSKSSTFLLSASTSTIIFNGSKAQTALTVGGDTLEVGNLEMNNSNGLALNAPIKVNGTLTLTDGIIYTTPSTPLVMSSTSSLGKYSKASFVSGPMQKQGSTAFLFPVGDNGRYGQISMEAPGDYSRYTAQYSSKPHSELFSASPIKQISTYEYWELVREYGKGSPKVTLYWNSDQSGITDLKTLRVAFLSKNTKSSKWLDGGNTGTTGDNKSGSIVSSDKIVAYNYFTFGSTNLQGLPVDLIDFSVQVVTNNGVEARWTTASELNNDYFQLERSADGTNFEKVTQIKGNGTTQSRKQYSYLDESPLPGRSYYRLKQVDFNGQSETFKVKTVQLPTANIENVGPNPFNNQFTLRYTLTQNGPVTLQLVNMMGGLSYEQHLQGNKGTNTFTYSEGQNLKIGTYVLRLIKDGEVVTAKLVKNLQ